MKHYLSSFGWLAIAVFQQWVFERTGIIWFSLAAAGAAALSTYKFYLFSRTL